MAWALSSALRAALAVLWTCAPWPSNAQDSQTDTNGGIVQSDVMVRPFMGPLVNLALERYPYARCLDGTAAGYYILPGDPKKFVVYLQGGGACINLLSCRVKTFSPLGSSKNWPLFHSFRMPGTLQNTDETGIHFSDATMVLIPYCSADMFTGATMKPSKDTFGFWFSGHHIINGVFDELLRRRGIKDANLVVIGGGADGGIGTVTHIDHIAEKFKKAGSSARIVGAPSGGFTGLVNLQVKPYTGPFNTPFVRSDAAVLPTYTHMWNSVGPKDCVALHKGEEWKCVLPAFVVPTLKTDVFFFQAQTDSIHLPKYYGLPESTNDADPPEAREWISNYVTLEKQELQIMLQSKSGQTGAHVGFFFPACWTHTYFEPVKINGFGYQEALVSFINSPSNMLLSDNCGLYCNAACTDPQAFADFNGPQIP
jgi:hypothetical protein